LSTHETEIRAGEGTGGKGCEGHPAGDAPAIFSAEEKIRIVLEAEASALKEVVAELTLENRRFRKNPLWLFAYIYPASPDEIGAPKWGIRPRTPL